MTNTPDSTDLALLERLQHQFPVHQRPFRLIAEELGMTEAEAVERTRRLVDAGFIRRIGAILSLRSLGAETSLAAMAVPDERLEEVAATINALPGVSHNYVRRREGERCDFNVWFTLRAPSKSALEGMLRMLREATGLRTLNLPALKSYKLSATFPLSEQRELAGSAGPSIPEALNRERRAAPAQPPDLRILRALQDGLPVDREPLARPAELAATTQGEVVRRISKMLESGFIRRMAAVVDHRALGFTANAMVVWEIPDEDVDRAGAALGRSDNVSHCFRRAAAPGWAYNLYAMVHARDGSDLQRIVRGLSESAGVQRGLVLHTQRELKKAAHLLPHWLSEDGD